MNTNEQALAALKGAESWMMEKGCSHEYPVLKDVRSAIAALESGGAEGNLDGEALHRVFMEESQNLVTVEWQALPPEIKEHMDRIARRLSARKAVSVAELHETYRNAAWAKHRELLKTTPFTASSPEHMAGIEAIHALQFAIPSLIGLSTGNAGVFTSVSDSFENRQKELSEKILHHGKPGYWLSRDRIRMVVSSAMIDARAVQIVPGDEALGHEQLGVIASNAARSILESHPHEPSGLDGVVEALELLVKTYLSNQDTEWEGVACVTPNKGDKTHVAWRTVAAALKGKPSAGEGV